MKVNELLENTKQQMRKGILELCILGIISEEEEAYPTYILSRLKEAELIVKEGTVYPLMTRLKEVGLLNYTWRESATGPPRKYYYLTDNGREFLEGLMSTWNQLLAAVQHSTKSQNQV